MNRIAQQVYDLALPLAEQQGIEIWDVTYTKEAGEWYLRVYIDKPDGVGITAVSLTPGIRLIASSSSPRGISTL